MYEKFDYFYDKVFSVEVFFAKGPGCKGVRVVGPAFPESSRVYGQLLTVPKGLYEVISDGWEKEIKIPRENIPMVMMSLYPNGCSAFNYEKILEEIPGDYVNILGYDD